MVTLPVGGDRFRAQVVAGASRAEGFEVQLLSTDMAAHPTAAGVEQQLLIRAENVEQIREILRTQELDDMP